MLYQPAWDYSKGKIFVIFVILLGLPLLLSAASPVFALCGPCEWYLDTCVRFCESEDGSATWWGRCDPDECSGGPGGSTGAGGGWYSKAYFYWYQNVDGQHQKEEPVVVASQSLADTINSWNSDDPDWPEAIVSNAYFHHTNNFVKDGKDNYVLDSFLLNGTTAVNTNGIVTIHDDSAGGSSSERHFDQNSGVFPFAQTYQTAPFRVGGVKFADYDTGADRPVYRYSCLGMTCRKWQTSLPVEPRRQDLKSELDWRNTEWGVSSDEQLIVQTAEFSVDYTGKYFFANFPPYPASHWENNAGAVVFEKTGGTLTLREYLCKENGADCCKTTPSCDPWYDTPQAFYDNFTGSAVPICNSSSLDKLRDDNAGRCQLETGKNYVMIAWGNGGGCYADDCDDSWAWPFLMWSGARLTGEVPVGNVPDPVAAIPLIKPVSLGCVSKTLQAAGVGLFTQPGEINLGISPAPGDSINPSVSSAKLYWDYKTLKGVVDDNAYVSQLDPAAQFSGGLVGSLLGPLLTFPNDEHSTSYAYGVDFTTYTTLNNQINVSEVYNEGAANQISNEASLALTLDVDPRWSQTLQTYEANDWFHWDFPLWHDPDSGNSDVYHFDLCEDAEDPDECASALDFPRQTRLTLLVGGRSRNGPRSSMLWMRTGVQPLEGGAQVVDHPEARIISENPLYRGVGYNGDEFNGIILESGEEGMIEIPAGHRYVSVQMESPPRGKYVGTDYESWSGESMTIIFSALETSCLPDRGLFPYTERTVLSASVSGPFPMCADADASGGSVDSEDIIMVVNDMNSDNLSFGEPSLGDVNNDGVVNSLDFSLSVSQQGTTCGK